MMRRHLRLCVIKKSGLMRINSTARTKLRHRTYLVPGTYCSYDHRVAGGERVDIFAIFDLKKGNVRNPPAGS